MPHHDGLPLVFQFPEEDTQPESQEHKALWDELELALREDAAPVPAPVPAPVAPTAPAPIPVALMGWEPHIVAELDPTGFHEVPADFHAPVHLPAHAPARALTCAPVLVPVDSACPRAGASAPLNSMDGRRRPLPCTSASRLLPLVDSLLETEVQNIVAFLEARPTSSSTPTMAQGAAVAVGQWPDDT